MHKSGTRILTASVTFEHFALIGSTGSADFYPVKLNATVLEKWGFIENKKYPLLPEAHEYKLVMPVIGSNQNDIMAYIKNNGECFARAQVNGLTISNNIFCLHQVQNLYYSLTGQELEPIAK